jgi:hypothetical protein
MPAFRDLTGQPFSHLTVIERAPNAPAGKIRWWCQCDCGNRVIVHSSALTSGHTQSCGCYRKAKFEEVKSLYGKQAEDLTGLPFGQLTVLELGPKKGNYRGWWCMCTCGTRVLVHASRLKHDITQSCGCLRIGKKHQENRPRHRSGLSNIPEYSTWRHMIARCYNPKVREYKYYGARGITVCERWVNSFIDFLADVGSKPGPEYTLERKNNKEPYTRDNVCWATHAEQMRNTRHNHLITIAGETECLAEWLHRKNMQPVTFHARKKRGMSDIEALTTPVTHARQPNIV